MAFCLSVFMFGYRPLPALVSNLVATATVATAAVAAASVAPTALAASALAAAPIATAAGTAAPLAIPALGVVVCSIKPGFIAPYEWTALIALPRALCSAMSAAHRVTEHEAKHSAIAHLLRLIDIAAAQITMAARARTETTLQRNAEKPAPSVPHAMQWLALLLRAELPVLSAAGRAAPQQPRCLLLPTQVVPVHLIRSGRSPTAVSRQ